MTSHLQLLSPSAHRGLREPRTARGWQPRESIEGQKLQFWWAVVWLPLGCPLQGPANDRDLPEPWWQRWWKQNCFRASPRTTSDWMNSVGLFHTATPAPEVSEHKEIQQQAQKQDISFRGRALRERKSLVFSSRKRNVFWCFF